MSIRDEQVSRREEKNLEEKRLIARYAASLIQDDDFVYLDAGTTTGCMLDYISDATTAVFVTNAPSHAQKLARKGMEVILIGRQTQTVYRGSCRRRGMQTDREI